MIGGLVLAGGRSRRFGRVGAMVGIAGEPMIWRVARVLLRGVDRIALSVREGSLAQACAISRGFDPLLDAAGDPEGPLAGVRAGLRWAAARGYEGLATSPCDAPFLPDDLVTRLLSAGRGAPAVAVTARGMEPLCAYWPASILPKLERLDDHPAVRTMLNEIGAAEALFADTQAFANLNTLADLRTAETRLGLR